MEGPDSVRLVVVEDLEDLEAEINRLFYEQMIFSIYFRELAREAEQEIEVNIDLEFGRGWPDPPLRNPPLDANWGGYLFEDFNHRFAPTKMAIDVVALAVLFWELIIRISKLFYALSPNQLAVFFISLAASLFLILLISIYVHNNKPTLIILVLLLQRIVLYLLSNSWKGSLFSLQLEIHEEVSLICTAFIRVYLGMNFFLLMVSLISYIHTKLLEFREFSRMADQHRETVAQIDQLPRISVEKYQLRRGDQLDTCPICLDDYSKEDKLVELKGCLHVMHIDCCKPWLLQNKSCPVCRASIGGR